MFVFCWDGRGIGIIEANAGNKKEPGVLLVNMENIKRGTGQAEMKT